MPKDAYYFSHDSNARHDPKLTALIETYGIAGYSYFFIFIEILREQKNYIFPKYLINALANAWQTHGTAMTPQNILDDMIKLQLIALNDDGYYSPSLCQRMSYFDDMRKKRSDAGAAGARALWQTHGKRMAKDGKESKVKESKKKNIQTTKEQYLDSVFLSQDEFLKLEKLYGKEGAQAKIYELNLGIMSKGYKYKSHYHTILSWDRKNAKSMSPTRGPGLTPEQMRAAH